MATPTFDRRGESGFGTRTSRTPPGGCARRRGGWLLGATIIATAWDASSSSSGFPGYDATMPKANGMVSEILVRNGYATFAVGKWHLAACWHDGARWPA